jgi:hypothetical protein
MYQVNDEEDEDGSNHRSESEDHHPQRFVLK